MSRAGGIQVTPEKPIPAHATSVVVWDGPSPASIALPARAKVGVQCERGCCLEGHIVKILDEAGNSVGEGALGTNPFLGTDALYWSEVSFPAPEVPGMVFRMAVYAPPPLGSDNTAAVAHHASSAQFSFRTDPQPDRRVTVHVRLDETSAPVPGAEIRLGLYAACTDESGNAEIHIPAGSYTCRVRKPGYEADSVSVDADRDLIVNVKARVGLSREEYDAWLSSYESHPWA